MTKRIHRPVTGPKLLQVLKGYLAGAIGVVCTTSAIQLIPGADRVANISLLYLLAVIATAYRFGSGAAGLAALLAVLSYNWFFVEPRHTFTANNPAEWLTLIIFLVTAVVISQLTQTLRLRAEEASKRERETAALSRASWAVASQVSHQEILTEVLRQTVAVIDCELAAILIPDEGDSLEVVASQETAAGLLLSFGTEYQQLRRLLESGREFTIEAYRHDFGPETVLSLLAMEGRVLGFLVLLLRQEQTLSREERRVVESLANHAAVALERHRLSLTEGRAQALIEADKLKTALLAMVSHDFRSPLTAIKASVTSLLQDDSPWEAATQHELLTGIDEETDRLNKMVGEILALSQLEAGAWRPQLESVPITELIGATLDSFSDTENARIQVSIDASAPEVLLDTVQIVQVLRNLLENALKYSPATSPVELRLEYDGALLSVDVLDRGYGLPEDEAEFIFERFYRATRWRESSLPGAGIGLALCRGLVEAHGGSLTAENRLGGGAVFHLGLPMSPGDSVPDTASVE